MRHSIKAQLTIAITTLLFALLAINGLILLRQKETELLRQTILSSENYGRLAARPFGTAYLTYYESGFATFLASAKTLLSQSESIENVRIVSYAGDVLYDAETERAAKLASHVREADPAFLERVRSVSPSMLTADGRLIETTAQLGGDGLVRLPARVNDIIVPYLDELGQHPFSLLFTLKYDQMEQVLRRTQLQISLFTLLAMALAALLGWQLARRIVQPVTQLTVGARALAAGHLEHRIHMQRKDELGVLAETFNQMAADLATSITRLLARQKIERELEIAAGIQRDLLPKTLPTPRGIELMAHSFPADQVGGDSYDMIPLPDGRMVFYIGDVTGHGLPAALVMAVANALIYSFAHTLPSTREIIIAVNQIMQAKTPANIFMTMTLLQWDEQNQELSYSGAGHDDLLVYRAATATIEPVRTGGMILGALPDVSNQTSAQVLPLKAGDLVVLSTDGIPEAKNPAGEMYGTERLKAVVDAGQGLPLPELFAAVLRDVRTFMDGAPQADDITLILVRRKGAEIPTLA